jgi:hypothetical protein
MGTDRFLADDPFDDPHWRKAELAASAPPKPAKGYVTVPLTWLQQMLPVVRTSDRLAVAMLLYRQCHLQRSKTVVLPNRDLRAMGVSRYTKYRALAELEAAGALIVEDRNGRSVRVTLCWFP